MYYDVTIINALRRRSARAAASQLTLLARSLAPSLSLSARRVFTLKLKKFLLYTVRGPTSSASSSLATISLLTTP